mmetsp:Transcript_6805/g.10429  ORF Transcript_6805/g.10429 Transcript_6805/m.10429 type:complete len:538 (+) Transcript_6805:389-2002(+)
MVMCAKFQCLRLHDVRKLATKVHHVRVVGVIWSYIAKIFDRYGWALTNLNSLAKNSTARLLSSSILYHIWVFLHFRIVWIYLNNTLILVHLLLRQQRHKKTFIKMDGMYFIQSLKCNDKKIQSGWRVSFLNADYSQCSSYPNKLIVPQDIDDTMLPAVFKYRSKGRIPVLSYHHNNTATITRCSQPMVGITGTTCHADEELLEAIRRANQTNPSVLFIYDCRPRANAMGNQAMGMGYEATGAGTGYANCKLEFLNIGNIHVMRNSLNKLFSLLSSTSDSIDEKFFSLLEDSGWLGHVRLVLHSSAKVAYKVEREACSVLIHCSDGWDRTAQVASLAQLLLDDYYRTIEGFELLIEKDWLSFGHKFHQRIGHGDKNYNDDQRAPIFLQFIDCVFQLLQQFPCSFEFNERFLIKIMDSLYSCLYGTFLFNSEGKRRNSELKRKTVSLWTDISRKRKEYVNVFYMPDMSVLMPDTSMERIQLWVNYYCRWKTKIVSAMSKELRGLQMIYKYEQERDKVGLLEEKVAKLEKQLKHFKKEYK